MCNNNSYTEITFLSDLSVHDIPMRKTKHVCIILIKMPNLTYNSSLLVFMYLFKRMEQIPVLMPRIQTNQVMRKEHKRRWEKKWSVYWTLNVQRNKSNGGKLQASDTRSNVSRYCLQVGVSLFSSSDSELESNKGAIRGQSDWSSAGALSM